MSQVLINTSPAMPIGEIKKPGSTEAFVSTSGELNAGNKMDLMRTIAQLAEVVASGQVLAEPKKKVVATAAERKTALLEALASPEKFETLGASIGGTLSVTANRDGFMRRVLERIDVAQGSIPRIRIKETQVVGSIASDLTTLAPQHLTDNHVYPPEFHVHTHLLIDDIELQQGSGDILQEKFFEGNEAIMVAEDRTWKAMTDNLASVSNTQQILAGGLTPDNLANMTSQIRAWGLPVKTLLIASDILSDFVGSNWSAALDPVSQYEILLSGEIGHVHGMDIITDAYRVPRQKVLSQGEVYVLSSPEYHGAYTDRGPVSSVARDGTSNGAPAKGWYMNEIISMLVANSKSIVRGISA